MPPQPFRFRFDLLSTRRLLVELHGVLGDDRAADHLVANVVDALAATPDVREVLMDVRALDDCTMSARGGLSSLQKLLARRQIRTAWLAGTPRVQGLARMIIVALGDQRAATFMTAQQADAWFTETAGRLDAITGKARGLS
jgi:hypothetical protein